MAAGATWHIGAGVETPELSELFSEWRRRISANRTGVRKSVGLIGHMTSSCSFVAEAC